MTFTQQAECNPKASPVQLSGHFHEGQEKGSMWAIGAYWYPWYGADGRHWDEGYMGTPWLGRYDSANRSVIRRQIEWAKWCGVDFFAASWWGINSYEDKVLREPFLAEAQSADFQFAILYESLGLLVSREGQIDLSLQHNQNKLVADFRYLARHYFRHPNYFCVNGRPVVFVYLTRIMVGDVAHALHRVREAVKTESGKELFLIGDEVYWHHPTAERLRLFDAVTAYNMHSSSPGVAESFQEKVLHQFYLWGKQASAVQVAFVPSAIPGFNDTAVRPGARHPIIPRSRQLFAEQLHAAFQVASGPIRLIMVTSWNEWHEDTSVEPAEEFGTEYLELIRDAKNQADAGGASGPCRQ